MKKLLKIILTVMALILTPLVVNAHDGEEHWEICIECGGTGSIIVGEWDGDTYVESEVPCPTCDGLGYIKEEPAATEEPTPTEAS